MKGKINCITICILTLVNTISGCQNETGEKRFVQDIPNDRNGNQAGIYKSARIAEEKIGLKSRITEGFNGMQIRIWFGHSLSDSVQLVLLQKQGVEWTAELYSGKYIYDKNTGHVDTISSVKIQKTPKDGWTFFTEKLFSMNVTQLRHSSLVPEYDQCADGYGASVEVATKEYYRICNYSCFQLFPNIPEAVSLENIIRLCEEQFAFRRVH